MNFILTFLDDRNFIPEHKKLKSLDFIVYILIHLWSKRCFFFWARRGLLQLGLQLDSSSQIWDLVLYGLWVTYVYVVHFVDTDRLVHGRTYGKICSAVILYPCKEEIIESCEDPCKKAIVYVSGAFISSECLLATSTKDHYCRCSFYC